MKEESDTTILLTLIYAISMCRILFIIKYFSINEVPYNRYFFFYFYTLRQKILVKHLGLFNLIHHCQWQLYKGDAEDFRN